MSMTFDTKIAIVVRDDLPTWQQAQRDRLRRQRAGRQRQRAGRRELRGCVGQPVPADGHPADDDLRGGRSRYPQSLPAGDGARHEDSPSSRASYSRRATSSTTGRRCAPRAPTNSIWSGSAMRDQKKEVDKAIKGLKFHAVEEKCRIWLKPYPACACSTSRACWRVLSAR